MKPLVRWRKVEFWWTVSTPGPNGESENWENCFVFADTYIGRMSALIESEVITKLRLNG